MKKYNNHDFISFDLFKRLRNIYYSSIQKLSLKKNNE